MCVSSITLTKGLLPQVYPSRCFNITKMSTISTIARELILSPINLY